MGYRELFLVLGGMVLLSLLMMQINRNAVEGREMLQQLEIQHTAASFAQQYLEEAKSKNFDDLVGIPPALMPGGFTDPNSLGPEGGEAYPLFNDVDDYDDYSDTLFVSGLDFRTTIDVDYVQDTKPDSAIGVQTYFKRMTVNVSSSWLPPGQTVTLKHVFTYFGVTM
jgi:hypothetical protein